MLLHLYLCFTRGKPHQPLSQKVQYHHYYWKLGDLYQQVTKATVIAKDVLKATKPA